MNDTYRISDDFIIKGNNQSIAFNINEELYFFAAFLEMNIENDISVYQVSFDSYKNIVSKNYYNPMKVSSSGFFIMKVIEKILIKHVETFGKNRFYALPADERLKRFYNLMAVKYNKRANTPFVVNTIKLEDGGEYDTRYEIWCE